jgi:hypothetical protein
MARAYEYPVYTGRAVTATSVDLINPAFRHRRVVGLGRRLLSGLLSARISDSTVLLGDVLQVSRVQPDSLKLELSRNGTARGGENQMHYNLDSLHPTFA